MQDFNFKPFNGITTTVTTTTTTRVGRTLDKPGIFTPFPADHNIHAFTSELGLDPRIFPNYAKPQPVSNQNFLLTPQNLGQPTKISKSVSPSRFADPSSTASTTSNLTYITASPQPNTRIFAPMTPTGIPTSIDFQLNKIPGSQMSVTPTHVTAATGGSGSHNSISPYNNSNGNYTPSTSPFNGYTPTTQGSNKIQFGASYDPNYPVQKINIPFSQFPNTPIQNLKLKDLAVAAGTPTQKIFYGKSENHGFPGPNPGSKPTTPMHNPSTPMYNPTTPKYNPTTPSNKPKENEIDPHMLLSRAKFKVEAGYTEPKKLGDDTLSTDIPAMRFSVIKSDFVDNPYYYNLDDVPESKRDTIKTQSSLSVDTSRLSLSALFTHSIRVDNQIGDYKTLLNRLKASGEKFNDPSFPANMKSLAGDNYSRKSEWEDLIWLRPEEFFGDKYDIFVDTIDPNDIMQGQLGDCYFLSVLSSLAEWPDRIRKVFKSKERNSAGCYCVRMCIMGEWKEIVVDDLIPCDRKTRKPIFTRSASNELWVLILEKAWAKLYGSYDIIESGLARECLHDLTCAPTSFFLTDDPKEYDIIWKTILKCEKKNYAMTCGAGDFFTSLAQSSRSNRNPSIQNIVNSMGIVSSHAYSLLAGYEVQSRYGGKVKLLKLRNPWGKTEWKGSWSDNSSEWDDNLRRQLNVQSKDDGVFFMEYSDFLKYFSDVQFCYIHDKHEYAYKTLHSDLKHAKYTTFTVTTPGKYYFTVNQESKRKFATSAMDKYPSATIVLAKLNKTSGGWEYQHIDGNQRADREVWIKAKLEPGEYIVYTKVVWTYCNDNDFVLSSYGPSKVKFEEVKKQDHPDFLEKTFMSKAQKSSKKADYAREGEASAYSVVELAKDGFIYCYYHNDSKRVLELEVNYKELTGLKLRKPFRGNKYQMKVNPGERRIVLLRIQPHQNVRQVLSERVRFTFPEERAMKTTIPAVSDVKVGYGTKNETNLSDGADLDRIVKEKGKVEKLQNPTTKATLDISVYEYKHEDGFVFLYENRTRNWTLNERVEFIGSGLILMSPLETEFSLLPGMTKKLVYRRIDSTFVPKFKFHSKLKEIL